ncbi:MAG: nitroreductase family protein [Bacteroides sp.]|nr:nitroreductase family protein [Bacteroides sp.]
MDHRAEILFSRRSIRQYKPGASLSHEQLHFLLDAAMSAPTARNRQPWQFVVVTRKDLLEELSRRHPYAKMLSGASLAVVVCGDPSLEQEESYLVQACSAATQNLLLAVEAMGLGGVWLGVHPRKERTEAIRELLGIPPEMVPVTMVSIGYPAEKKPRNANYRHDRVHKNGWTNTVA